MLSSTYGLFILVDYPLNYNLKGREIYYYIYYKTYIFRKIGGQFFWFYYYPCCGQENWFQNQSTEDFSVDKRWTPILSIAPTILNEVTNILF